jgi:hypothetical protein
MSLNHLHSDTSSPKRIAATALLNMPSRFTVYHHDYHNYKYTDTLVTAPWTVKLAFANLEGQSVRLLDTFDEAGKELSCLVDEDCNGEAKLWAKTVNGDEVLH